MSKITFLQVGDVHYPDWSPGRYEADIKDPNVSKSIKIGVTHKPLQRVLAKLSYLAAEETTECVAIMGDFTSIGDKKNLKACLHHLSWLLKSDRSLDARPKLLAVPGNHDVNRDDAINFGLTGKFDFINECGSEALWYPMPVDDCLHTQISTGQYHADFFLLNTTLGSWEKYLLPKSISASIEAEKLNDAVGSIEDAKMLVAGGDSSNDAIESYYDQLDTPYVSSKGVNQLEEKIRDLPRQNLPVIVGHHNVLPQVQPRLSPYAEMLNSGFFRNSLSSLNRPIVYLHGHVHHDIVEVIQNPRFPASRIFSIGAPEISKGFNEISAFFDRNKQPIGLRILPWRISNNQSSLRPLDSEQIVLNLQNQNILRPSKDAEKLFELMDSGVPYNIPDLEEIENDMGMTPVEIEAAILQLFFLSWIHIDQVGESPMNWIIRKQSQ